MSDNFSHGEGSPTPNSPLELTVFENGFHAGSESASMQGEFGIRIPSQQGGAYTVNNVMQILTQIAMNTDESAEMRNELAALCAFSNSEMEILKRSNENLQVEVQEIATRLIDRTAENEEMRHQMSVQLFSFVRKHNLLQETMTYEIGSATDNIKLLRRMIEDSQRSAHSAAEQNFKAEIAISETQRQTSATAFRLEQTNTTVQTISEEFHTLMEKMKNRLSEVPRTYATKESVENKISEITNQIQKDRAELAEHRQDMTELRQSQDNAGRSLSRIIGTEMKSIEVRISEIEQRIDTSVSEVRRLEAEQMRIAKNTLSSFEQVDMIVAQRNESLQRVKRHNTELIARIAKMESDLKSTSESLSEALTAVSVRVDKALHRSDMLSKTVTETYQKLQTGGNDTTSKIEERLVAMESQISAQGSTLQVFMKKVDQFMSSQKEASPSPQHGGLGLGSHVERERSLAVDQVVATQAENINALLRSHLSKGLESISTSDAKTVVGSASLGQIFSESEIQMIRSLPYEYKFPVDSSTTKKGHLEMARLIARVASLYRGAAESEAVRTTHRLHVRKEFERITKVNSFNQSLTKMLAKDGHLQEVLEFRAILDSTAQDKENEQELVFRRFSLLYRARQVEVSFFDFPTFLQEAIGDKNVLTEEGHSYTIGHELSDWKKKKGKN